MPGIRLNTEDIGVEPAPSFATDAEIELAQRLRYRLEERYFGPSSASGPLQTRSDEAR
jgi:hypothetical protein